MLAVWIVKLVLMCQRVLVDKVKSCLFKACFTLESLILKSDRYDKDRMGSFHMCLETCQESVN